MKLKITLIKPITECIEFEALLKKHNVSAERLFADNSKKFVVEGTQEVFNALEQCPDTFDVVVDNENSEPL